MSIITIQCTANGEHSSPGGRRSSENLEFMQEKIRVSVDKFVKSALHANLRIVGPNRLVTDTQK